MLLTPLCIDFSNPATPSSLAAEACEARKLQGLTVGGGHFEVIGDGSQARLRYRLDPPYDRRFDFVTPLHEITEKLTSVSYRQSTSGSGLTPLNLFAINVWEAALTANEGETLMDFFGGGVRTFTDDQHHGIK